MMSQEPKNHEEQEQTSASTRNEPDGFLVFDVHTLAHFHEDRPFVQVLLERGTTRLVLFAFKAGQRLQDHHTPRQLLVQVVRGQITFTITDNSVTLQEGSVLHVEANISHSVLAQTDAVMLLTMTPSPSSHPLHENHEVTQGDFPLVTPLTHEGGKE